MPGAPCSTKTYPRWYQGDAFVERVGDLLVILNGHENRDQSQAYSIPMTPGRIMRLSGTIEPHSYIIAKCDGGPDRPH